jgi:hypothetical protein
VQIDSNGALSGTLTNEAGGNAAASGTLTITSDGVITSNTDVRLRCALDSDRTLVACIDSR